MGMALTEFWRHITRVVNDWHRAKGTVLDYCSLENVDDRRAILVIVSWDETARLQFEPSHPKDETAHLAPAFQPDICQNLAPKVLGRDVVQRPRFRQNVFLRTGATDGGNRGQGGKACGQECKGFKRHVTSFRQCEIGQNQ